MAVRYPVDLAGIACPIAELFLGVIGQRAHHGNTLAGSRGERQGSVILQQCDGFAGDLQVELLVFAGADNFLHTLFVRQTWVFEQSQAELQCENAGHGLIDQRFIQQAALDGLDGALIELRRSHDQIVACFDRIRGGLHVIGLDLLLPHGAADVVPISDECALVVPIAT